MTELRATYRLQLGRRPRLRAGARARALPAPSSASRTSTCRRPSRPARARRTATTSSTRRAISEELGGEAEFRALVAAAHERRARRRPRHRPQPHGDRRRQPLLGRPGAARAGSSTSTRRPAATGASSTSTTSPACARRTRRCSRRRTGWRCRWSREGVGRRPAHRPPRRARRPGRLPRAPARRRASSTSGSRRSSTRASSCATGRSTGTVGYEFLNDVAALFVDPAARRRSTALWARGHRRRAAVRRGRATRPSSSRPRGTFAPEVERLRARSHDRRRPRRGAGRRCRSTAPTSATAGSRREDARAIAARGRALECAARRRRPRVRHALPADDAAGDGQGRRGHRLLPLRRACSRSTRSAATRAASASRSSASTPATASAPSASRATCWSRRRTTPSARATCARGSARWPAWPTEWAAHVRTWLGAAGGRAGARRRRALLHLPDARRRLADRARAARGLHGEGAARGQAQHELDRARRGARGGGQGVLPRPATSTSAFRADFEPFADAVARAGERAALGQLLLKLTVPGRARHLPGRRAALAVAGRPRQPPPGRLGRAPRGARRAGRRRRAGPRDVQAARHPARAGAARAAAGGVRRRLHAGRRRRRRRARSCAATARCSSSCRCAAARRARRSSSPASWRARGATCSPARCASSRAARRCPSSPRRTAWRCSSACDDAPQLNARGQ